MSGSYEWPELYLLVKKFVMSDMCLAGKNKKSIRKISYKLLYVESIESVLKLSHGFNYSGERSFKIFLKQAPNKKINALESQSKYQLRFIIRFF